MVTALVPLRWFSQQQGHAYPDCLSTSQKVEVEYSEKRITMVLEEEYGRKLAGYCLCRSLEKGDNERPIVDGLYIQCEDIGQPPPGKMNLKIEMK
jgi:hypothetical protein